MEKDTQLVTHEKNIENYVDQLKKKEIDFFGVPEEYRSHPSIVKCGRKLGMRKSDKRGYDVIRDNFFVEEIITTGNYTNEVNERRISNYFMTFAQYYEFLDGDIYESACYYQYVFSQEEVDSFGIDLCKINMTSLIDITTKEFRIDFSDEELQQYNELEKDKTLRKKWIAKFNSCNTYEDFKKVVNNFGKSKFSSDDLLFFFFNFIFADKDKAFDIIMQYVSDGAWPSYRIEKALCYIYDPQKVLSAYNYKLGASSTIRRRKKEFAEYIKQVENDELQFSQRYYFDENTHFFCYEKNVYIDKEKQWFPTVVICRYFETLQEFAEHLNNDLSDCDLSKAILPCVDFSIYKTNKHTKLPIQNQNNLIYTIYKRYDRKKDRFVVKQNWKNANGQTIKNYVNTFKHFFDFVYFLENDLSDADLLFCEGLNNLHDFLNIDFTNARLRSNIFDKIGMTYQLSPIDTSRAETFPSVIKNEKETEIILSSKRKVYYTEETIKNQKVFYISDLHLIHRLQNATCKSKDDVLYVIQKIIDNIIDGIRHVHVPWENYILLIGGDTSSDFNLFSMFIQLLRDSMDVYNLNIQVVFLLGNHELWGFSNYSFKEIVHRYELEITKNKMYLLQNDIIYKGEDNEIKIITTDELLSMSMATLRTQLQCARIIIFGGLAFSGYNEEFNADNGIYRHTIDREQEIAETREFERLYSIVCSALYDRNVIVFTHTPQKDWCSHDNQQPGFVYVSGHTHRNYFYDDGEYRTYADNQIGYGHAIPSVKYFYLDDEYDLFSEYGDGIYEITKEQYINFYRGKNITMTFNREINVLYMLKKSGYYCFIHKSLNKQLTILNGGASKKLDVKDINYYYERMEAVIAYIKSPLDKFAIIQKQIANEIRAIGGYGTIHGAIIDIDYYNHIYVNPYDLTITGYWALDIIYKKVFPNVPKLLESNCPSLYEKYVKLLNGKAETFLATRGDEKQELDMRPHIYLDTDIYKASREIKKMQKLNSNILSVWYEPTRKKLE